MQTVSFLVMEMDGQLHPFEIKRAVSPERKIIKTFSLLRKSEREIGAGGIICMAAKPFPIDAENSMVPVNLL